VNFTVQQSAWIFIQEGLARTIQSSALFINGAIAVILNVHFCIFVHLATEVCTIESHMTYCKIKVSGLPKVSK